MVTVQDTGLSHSLRSSRVSPNEQNDENLSRSTDRDATRVAFCLCRCSPKTLMCDNCEAAFPLRDKHCPSCRRPWIYAASSDTSAGKTFRLFVGRLPLSRTAPLLHWMISASLPAVRILPTARGAYLSRWETSRLCMGTCRVQAVVFQQRIVCCKGRMRIYCSSHRHSGLLAAAVVHALHPAFPVVVVGFGSKGKSTWKGMRCSNQRCIPVVKCVFERNIILRERPSSLE